MFSFRHSAFAIALFAPVVAACGTDAPAAADSDTPASVATVAPREVTIRARDNVFHEAPQSLPAGLTNIRLINEGPMFHHAWIVRLEEGKRLNDLLEHFSAGNPPPSWMIDVGGPNTPGAPGLETAAIVDLQPGNYAIICVIDLPDGVPHIMKGMAHEFTVTPAEGPAATLPEADIVMTLDDYSFATDVAITPGTHTIRVENNAAQPHEVLFVKLEEGRTVEDFMEFLKQPDGTPPGSVLGGTTGIAHGGMNQITLTFEMGDYALICFIPDDKDGRPHFLHGMVQQIHVM
jgi:hypothetical protein